MSAYKRAIGSMLIAMSGLGLMASAGQAQSFTKDELVDASIPAAVDYNSRLNGYFEDDSIKGDAKFIFGVEYGDRSIRKSARQLEALYLDLLKQQDDDHPIVRTKDLPTPFNSSILSEQSPARFNSGFN